MSIARIVLWGIGILLGIVAVTNFEQFTIDPMSTARKGARDLVDRGLDATLGEGFDNSIDNNYSDFIPPYGRINELGCEWKCDYACDGG